MLAFVRDHNLWVRVLEPASRFPLSRDGERYYDYAMPLPSPTLMVAQGTEDVVQAPAVFWSPDSTRIATYVMDQRNFPRLTITQSAPPDQFRPKYFSYAYPLPVDFDLPTAKLVSFDVPRRKQITVWAKPLNQLYYGGPALEWSADSRRFTYREIERGYKHVRLLSVDAATGVSRTILDEKGVPLVDTSILLTRSFNGGREVVWSAERDGWNHFYLYDAENGALKNQITKGDWVVRAIDYIDEPARVLYFSAGGREAGRDPYLRHIYRVSLDGSGLTLLTPEDADHAVSFSPDGKYFVDAYSRVDLPTVSVLRRSEDGRVVKELEKADFSQLTAMGWRLPGTVQGEGGRRQDRSLRAHLAADELRSEEEVSGDREHLHRPAGRVRAEDVCGLPPPAAGDRRARVHHRVRRRARHGAALARVSRARPTTTSARAPAATITSRSSSRWRRSIRTWI